MPAEGLLPGWGARPEGQRGAAYVLRGEGGGGAMARLGRAVDRVETKETYLDPEPAASKEVI